VDSAEENRANYCKVLSGKTLFSALYGTYTVTLNALKAILKASTQPGQNNAPTPVHQQSAKDGGFQEVRRRKRQGSEETAKVSKKPTVTATTPAAVKLPPRETATRNFFAPLRTAEMDTDTTITESTTTEEAVTSKTSRLPQSS
jgi:hypothetical protein